MKPLNRALKPLAQILGISDTKTVRFTGYTTYEMAQEIGKVLEPFILQDPSFIHNISKIDAICPAGWKGHAIGLAFYDNYCIYTNTGAGAKNTNSGTYIIPINSDQKDSLTQIFSNNTLDRKLTMKRLKENLPEIHSIINADIPDLKQCMHLPQKRQKRGNCTKSSLTKIFKGVFLISEAKKSNQSDSIQELSTYNSHNNDKIQQMYKTLSTAIRQYALNKLIANLDNPENIAEARLTANHYILQHKASNKPFFKKAYKTILLKLLEIDGYTYNNINLSDAKSNFEINTDIAINRITELKEDSSSLDLDLAHHSIAKNLGLTNTFDYTSLQAASTSDPTSLLENKDSNNNTPLHLALKKGHNEKVYLFVKAIFKQNRQDLLNIKNSENISPLEQSENKTNIFEIILNESVINNDIDLFKNFIDNVSATQPNLDLKKLLYLATENSQIDIMSYLLNKGANISVDKNLLLFAISRNNLSAVSFLLQSQNNLNFYEKLINKTSTKSLINLMCHKKLKIPQDILDKFLYLAIKNGKNKLIKNLIIKGANINYKAEGQTPLHDAITNNNPFAIIFLLSRNADTNITNNEDKLPLDLLIENQALAEKVIGLFTRLSSEQGFSTEFNEFINNLTKKIDQKVTAVTSDDLKSNELKQSDKASSTESDVSPNNQANNSDGSSAEPTV